MSRDPQALLELYAGRALEPLDPQELDELRELESVLGSQEDEAFEQTVAAVALAGVTEYFEPMPDDLRLSLANASPGLAAPQQPSRVSAPRSARGVAPRRRIPTGWLAAAVCLAVAVFGWSRSPRAPEPPTSLPPQAARASLLRSTPGVLQIAWSPTEDPLGDGATGDVVWDNRTQEGFMTFHGLPANDPSRHQYQLWIFDGTRNPDHPIDGGVFDVVGDGTVVPIDAKLDVREPTLFAVTLEPPGGVVVSRRDHLLLVAAVAP